MNTDYSHLPTDIYRLILENVPIVTVDVLFFNGEKTKTLLFKRNNEPLKDTYFSIGGRLLKNERLIDGAVRQVQREAGFNVDKDHLIFGGVQDEMLDASIFKNITLHDVNIFYGYILGQEKIFLDNQHSEQKWFSIYDKTLHPLLVSKLIKTVVKI